MRTILVVAFLSLASVMKAQNVPSARPTPANMAEPKLPFIDDKACPLETNPVSKAQIQKAAKLYSSWRERRTLVGTLSPHEQVSVLRGLNVIQEPAQALLMQPIHRTDGLSLKAGEVVLRYGLNAAQHWEFRGEGRWFTEYIDFVVEKDGQCTTDDAGGCRIKIVRNGAQEWWLEVSSEGRKGWVLGQRRKGDETWNDPSFVGLCMDLNGD